MEEQRKHHKILQWLKSLSNEYAAYVFGLFFLGVATLINRWTGNVLVWIACASILWGLLLWGLPFVEKITQSLIGKAIGGIFLVAATAFNLALAGIVVNQTLQAPASAFGYTHTIVALLTVPFTAALFFSFSALFLILVAVVSELGSLRDFTPKGLISGKLFRGKQKNFTTIFIFRVIAAVTLFSVSVSFLNNNKPYSETLSHFTRWFAYNFEMERISFCKLPQETHVAYLDGNRIVTGKYTKKEYQFKVETCDSTVNPN